jgi:hypothetical protein
MRELHGVLPPGVGLSRGMLKHHSLLFDSFVIPDLNGYLDHAPGLFPGELLEDMQFLQSSGLLRDADLNEKLPPRKHRAPKAYFVDPLDTEGIDSFSRYAARLLSTEDSDVVPI